MKIVSKKTVASILFIISQTTCMQATESGDRYTVDKSVAQVKDVADVPSLKHLCTKIIREDWSIKSMDAFKLVKKNVYNDDDNEQIRAILLHNQHLQHSHVAAHAEFTSIFDMKHRDDFDMASFFGIYSLYPKKISEFLVNQQNWSTLSFALEHGLTAQEYKQSALEYLNIKVGRAFTLAKKQNWNDTDYENFTQTLVTAEDLCRNVFISTGITLPSIYHFEDNQDGYKIVHFIMRKKDSIALQCMLDHGLNLYECDKRNNSLLHVAISEKADDCVQIILNYKKQGKFFLEQQQKIDEQDVHDKLQLINMSNDQDYTPLRLAVKASSSTITQLLLTAGADVNQSNKNSGRTVLHSATITEKIQMIPLLLAAGARVDQADHEGQTALHWSTMGDSIQMLSLLIDAGARVNPIDKHGHTPLFYAEEENSNLVIPLLIAAGGWVTKPVTTHTYNLRSKKRKLS